MPKKYNCKQVQNKIAESIKKPETIYKADCVNWSGRTNDSNELSSEIIAGLLLEKKNSGWLKGIGTISREETYNPHLGAKFQKTKSNRKEEQYAGCLFNTKAKLGTLGKVIEYQVPLKNIRGDRAGKIDLVTYNESKNSFYLIEFKLNNTSDTLLKTVLEIETYYLQLDPEKFRCDFNTNPQSEIYKAVLLQGKPEGCLALKEAKEVNKINLRPKLKKLIQKLQIGVYELINDGNIEILCQ
jgi:hypothetical protein